MKSKILKPVLIVILFVLYSCNETIVTNIVHSNGSVTRRVVIKDNDKKSFNKDAFRVPVNDTWTISDTFELDEKGDTTWIRTAEKLFKNVEEINKEYSNDKGSNRNFAREARFSRKFRWFNTLYTFSENIDKTLQYGYPVEQYLTKQELEYFYMPESILNERKNGSDSLKVKQIIDTVHSKTEKWQIKCYISEWREEFLKLAEKRGQVDVNKEFLLNKDLDMINMLEISFKDTGEFNYDTVFSNIMKTVFGDNLYLKYKPEIDSSVKILQDRSSKNGTFQGYSVKTLMPGKMVATNGFIDQKGEILWTVESDYFLTEPYQMWAESKTSNTWAWIVSGVFLLFVMAGMVFRLLKK